MTEVTIEHLRKEYGDTIAINGISFDIGDGEILTLVGPSGCGKTTTLRCIAGLEEPTSGSIKFGQKEMVGVAPQNRNIALLFQQIALWDHMTVRENIEYPLKLDNVNSERIISKTDRTAKELQIHDKLNQYPTELSGGQQQRVSLARAMVQDPGLFLFDEPLSALDAALKREIRPLIQQIVHEVHVPAIYVTHDQEEAMTLSDKIVVMNEGEIEQMGEPLEIFRKPQNAFVAGFIGTPKINFIRTESSNGSIKFGGHEIPAPSGSDGAYLIGVRPQAMNVREPGVEDGIEAVHQLDEPKGDMTHSHFSTDHGEFIAVTSPGFNGQQDDYSLTFELSELHLFNPSGERVTLDTESALQ